MAATLVTRFAPSPTGRLHLGHAHSALLAWRLARAAGGRFLLRIEDIDPVRCRPDFVDGILEDLAWLGLDWDGPVRRQSEHLPEYRAALHRLDGMGLLYPCFCTRADIAREIAAIGHAPHGPDGALYPGTCRRLSPRERAGRVAAGQPYALRLDMAAALARAPWPLSCLEQGQRRRCDPAQFGDVVLARKDIPASYHLCVTHDDALQGVTLVTRAEDLAPATDLHRLLQALLGWKAPRYCHHALLLGADGKRLSKRDNAPTLQGLREQGLAPEKVREMASAGGE
ncbi:tRNA glutamyl-Q(34) synthetase GluQRS [Pseudoroseomonas cervicalis]|uniref:tRNA glutamyl-Q(34) synthetase GluQRS n=1 Tax=Teichococcus cervicalis TaxID=204525 RepID=UPI0022F1715B|nr:tRNA glutamyl-Q(34) synthetase GluQRS [Pseudoroseomonas cervicalis]WBV42009.1 tRNA glutamyl-Q(34) synthetase GluQRS [Pseudoroseomonas cervicalis]